jgi:hypothetical protein
MSKRFLWSLLLAAVTLVAILTDGKTEYGPPAVLNCSNAPIGVTISRPDAEAGRGQSQVLTQKTRRSILWSNGQTVAHRVSWRDLSRA